MKAPGGNGEYHSQWRLWKSPSHAGPTIDIWFKVASNTAPEKVKFYRESFYQNLVWEIPRGFSNDPNNDSKSIDLPGGWSVVTYRGNDRGGERRCWNADVPKLEDHGWMYDNESVEVFDRDGCAGIPTQINPADNANYTIGDNINFIWNTSSNADQYILRIWGMALSMEWFMEDPA